MKNESKKPEKKFRSGSIIADVWNNTGKKDGKEFSFKTVSIQRGYKDDQDEWKNTNSLRASDIPRALLVLQKAYEYTSLNNDADE